jgi:hypothetical protein
MAHQRCTCVEQVWIDAVTSTRDAALRELAIVKRELEELKHESKSEREGAIKALELAVSDINELDTLQPGVRIAPATVRGYLTKGSEIIAERGR